MLAAAAAAISSSYIADNDGLTCWLCTVKRDCKCNHKPFINLWVVTSSSCTCILIIRKKC